MWTSILPSHFTRENEVEVLSIMFKKFEVKVLNSKSQPLVGLLIARSESRFISNLFVQGRLKI